MDCKHFYSPRRGGRRAPGALAGLLALTVFACGGDGDGGGGGTQPPPVSPTTATGVFKDSNVAGLDFQSGGQSGVTNSAGEFSFEVGEQVSFSVGSLSVGTGPAKAIMTPLDLVAGGTTADPQVQNIARFLQLLDANGAPEDGIDISAAVRTLAENWNGVDFAAADLETQLTNAGILSDVASVNPGASLPSVADAIDHLRATFVCINSGAFTGSFAGDDSGVFGILVNAGTGIVQGVAFSTVDQELIGLTGAAATALDDGGSFIAGTTSDGATFSGSFSDPDTLAGTWELLAEGSSGTFSGSRVGGAGDAVLRFTGSFESTPPSLEAVGFFTFDVDAAGTVTGTAVTVAAADGTTNESIGLTGTLTGDDLNATTADGDATITGTLNAATGGLSGTWSDSDGNTGIFSGSGCVLNPAPGGPSNPES